MSKRWGKGKRVSGSLRQRRRKMVRRLEELIGDPLRCCMCDVIIDGKNGNYPMLIGPGHDPPYCLKCGFLISRSLKNISVDGDISGR